MPLRKNICCFPLMSYISSSHFLSVILLHSGRYGGPWCPLQKFFLVFCIRSSVFLSTSPFLHQPVVLFSSAGVMHLLLWFSCEGQGRSVQGAPTTICLSGNVCAAEAQGQHSAMPSPKLAVCAVSVRKHDHPVRTEDKSRKTLIFSFWTLSSLVLPTWHIFPTIFVVFVFHCCM